MNYEEVINGKKYYRGIIFSFLDTWKAKLNCSYRVIECDYHDTCKQGHHMGQIRDELNGTWGGLLSLLIRREADIVSYDWPYNSQRDQVADFLYPLYEKELGIIVPVDESEKAKHRLSMDQFGFCQFWSTWLVICGYLLSVYLIVRLAANFSFKPRAMSLNLRLADVLCLILYRKYIGQTKYDLKQILPPFLSNRPLAIVWWEATIIMRNVFLATLVASILVPPVVHRIQSLEQLHRESIPLMATDSGSASTVLNPQSPVPLFRAVGLTYRRVKAPMRLFEAAEADEMVAITTVNDMFADLVRFNSHLL